jgi:cell division protein FtsX
MTKQKTIDVRDQVTLSFENSLRFCLKGISYRLFRSSLTLAVVIVAVAFFTVLLSESLMLRSTSRGVHEEMRSVREADSLFMHLFHRYSTHDLSLKLAEMKHDEGAIGEVAAITGMSGSVVNDLVEQCYVEQLFLHFFRTLSPGKRAVLVKKETGRGIFNYLSNQDEWDAFVASLDKMRSVRLPLELATLRGFLDTREEFMAALKAVQSARNATVNDLEVKLNALTGGEDFTQWLGSATPEQAEQWRAIVVASGFMLEPDEMARVQRQLRVSALEDRIGTLLQTPDMREAWKVKFKTTPGLEEKLMQLKEPEVGALLGDAFSEAERADVVDRFANVKHLRALIRKLPRVESAVAGEARFLDGRQIFLIIISFLVCMVGIANAMLMSITERFREIATMKCLGATDGFILKQFLIEAAIQGVVGGSIGMVIGMIVSVIKSSIMLGGSVFRFFPAMDMLYCAIVTVLIGIGLAMLASIYPSRAAAKMAPMDAMRVE